MTLLFYPIPGQRRVPLLVFSNLQKSQPSTPEKKKSRSTSKKNSVGKMDAIQLLHEKTVGSDIRGKVI